MDSDYKDMSRWMENVGGDRKLSDLSIPGTHDTCAHRLGTLCYYWCQRMTLAEQLDAGVRFIDIRCQVYSNRLRVVHADLFENLMFEGDVLDVCRDFLSSHPSECIVMSVKEDAGSEQSSHTFAEAFALAISDCRDDWYLGNTIPTLDEVRGKIVLLQRYNSEGAEPWGIYAAPNVWQDNAVFDINGQFARLRIQDCYKVPFWATGTKWSRVSNMLDDAGQPDSADRWVINFCSGSGATFPPGWPPHTIARYINGRLFAYLLDKTEGRLGTVLMDFPRYGGLVKKIAAHNLS